MIRQDDLPVLRALEEAGRAGRRCALATVVETRGSSPRKAGAKMLVCADGTLVGTVGGGCGEAEVLEAARRILDGGEAETVRVELTRDLHSTSPGVCGGTMEIFVEAVAPFRGGERPAEAPRHDGTRDP